MDKTRKVILTLEIIFLTVGVIVFGVGYYRFYNAKAFISSLYDGARLTGNFPSYTTLSIWYTKQHNGKITFIVGIVIIGISFISLIASIVMTLMKKNKYHYKDGRKDRNFTESETKRSDKNIFHHAQKEVHKMGEIRESLKAFFEQNRIIKTLRPIAFVFPLVYPLLNIINGYIGFYSYSRINSIFYLLYLFGLFLCFVESVDWAIGIAFALNAVFYILRSIYYFSYKFNFIIYIIFYILLACCFLRKYVLLLVSKNNSNTGTTNYSSSRDQSSSEKSTFSQGTFYDTPHNATGENENSEIIYCMTCGCAMPHTAKFCAHCGSPITTYTSTTQQKNSSE